MKTHLYLIFINISVFLISYLFNVHNLIILLGANNASLVFDQGEYYRLFTAMFLHSSLTHLIANMFSLWQIGSFLEGGISPIKFLLLYFISGLFGSFFSIFFQDNILSVGESGAIFGLIGALLSWSLLKKQWSIVRIVMLNLILNIFITLSIPNIDSFGHLGGFLAGFLLGFLFFSTGPKVVLVED